MSLLAKIRNLPLLRSFGVKKAKAKGSLASWCEDDIRSIVACLDYVTIYAMAWAGQSFAYSICTADQHPLLPRPREMTLTFRGGVKSSLSWTSSDGFEKGFIKIREAKKAPLGRNVARSVESATKKILKRWGQHPLTHLELLDVSQSGFEELLRACPPLETVDRLTCGSYDFVDYGLGRFTRLTTLRLIPSGGYRLNYDQRVDHFEKLFGALALRTLHHLEVCDEVPLSYPLYDFIIDCLFDFSRLCQREKFVRFDGALFKLFKWKLTKRLADAKESIAFVSASVSCFRHDDNADMLNDLFVKERSRVTCVVAPSGRKITTIRQGDSFIVTNNMEWLQQRLPGLSFA